MKGFTKEQKLELEQQVRQGNADNKLFKKVQVVNWRAQGRSIDEIVELSGLSCATVFRACAAYRSGGVGSLRERYAGNYRKLSFAEEAAALDKLSVGAGIGKYVRVKELLRQFEELTGVTYHMNAFYLLLHRHGWRKVAPRGQHPKAADKASCEDAKKLTIL